MNFSNLLVASWNDVANMAKLSWVKDLFSALTPILWAIMAFVGAAGIIYSVVLGVNLAKAEDQSKRDEAKKRLITTIVAVGVVVVLVIFFNTLLPMIIGTFLSEPDNSSTTNQFCISYLNKLLKN